MVKLTECWERRAWVEAAREALEKVGIGAVRVELLAKRLSVSAGSFYWHFKSQECLLDALLADWLESNIRPFYAILNSSLSPECRLIDLAFIWSHGKNFDCDYDLAIRDWARTSATVAQTLLETDRQRIDIVRFALQDYGVEGDEAFIRARIIYFHQVGYHVIKMEESQAGRMDLFPDYFHTLVGRPLTAEGLAYFAQKNRQHNEQEIQPISVSHEA